MEQELTIFIEKFIKEHRKITNHDIAYIFSVLVKKMQLTDYIKRLTFINEIYSEIPDIMYFLSEKRLYVNYTLKDSKPLFMNDNFKAFFRNDEMILQLLNIIYRLILELSKIKNWQIACSLNKNIESTIIRANLLHQALYKDLIFAQAKEELPPIMMEMYENYGKKIANYKTGYEPVNHLAEFYANMTIWGIVEKMAPQTPNMINYIRVSVLENLSKDYKNNILIPSSPTMEYLENIHLKKIFQEFSFYSPSSLVMNQNIIAKFSLPNRIKWGLPVAGKELKRVRKQYLELIS